MIPQYIVYLKKMHDFIYYTAQYIVQLNILYILIKTISDYLCDYMYNITKCII